MTATNIDVCVVTSDLPELVSAWLLGLNWRNRRKLACSVPGGPGTCRQSELVLKCKHAETSCKLADCARAVKLNLAALCNCDSGFLSRNSKQT